VDTYYGTGLQDMTDAQQIEALIKEADSFRSPCTRRYEDALNAYEACIAKLSGAGDVAAQHAVARAKLGKGACYFDLKKDDDGRHFLEAFAAEPDGGDPFLADLHAQSLLAVGQKLVDKEMLDDAAAVFRTGLDRFASNADGALHDTVSLIFFNLGSALTEQKRDQDALANYERLLIHLQTSTGPSSADEVSDASWRKGHSLQRLGRKDEA
jgi:tetratricopeptide (TPR) repeat protein